MLDRYEQAILWTYEQSAPHWSNLPEVETDLRKVQGFSRREAKKIIRGAKTYDDILVNQRDSVKMLGVE